VASGDRARPRRNSACAVTLVNWRWSARSTRKAGLARPTSGFLDRFSRVEAALGGDLGVAHRRTGRDLWRQARRNRAEAAGLRPAQEIKLRDHCHRPLGTPGPLIARLLLGP